ncbi:MAG: hypothetical protein QOH90_2424 [Actinomycetota bacterium]|jgi:hypothetical protein|nr:hypothetical protein [Actinomycetota bacterium]
MKKILLMAGAAGLTIVMAVAVLAASNSEGGHDYTINHQSFRWRTSNATTSDTDFNQLKLNPSVPGAAQFIVARGPISATFSGTFKGGAVDVIVKDGTHRFQPGVAHFGKGSSSYTFVTGGRRKSGCHYITVQWRSRAGQQVTLTGADLVVDYHHKTGSDVVTC